MESPREPASPSSSSTSGSPPPEERVPDESTFINMSSASSLSGPPKRRLGPSPFGGGPNARETKSRRREDNMMRKMGPAIWDSREAGMVRPKDDLVDQPLVDNLRKQFGDPFDDSIVKKAA
ncbi:hypothetical protein AcW1_007888 [Taiwanofungus camphoratus]|nr:hypothetical protein AcW2_007055 [Antrodia cinnamomea]KAI0953742.1 hypothetical protein AcW1_007888 [Antrodia cinnamomea]